MFPVIASQSKLYFLKAKTGLPPFVNGNNKKGPAQKVGYV
jgi:hypothetical protein